MTALALGLKRTWAPSVNVPYGVSELGAPGGYTAVLERGMKENDSATTSATTHPPLPGGQGQCAGCAARQHGRTR